MYDQYNGAAMQGIGAGNALVSEAQFKERYEKLTVRDNIEQQIAKAKDEVARLEGIRDRLAPELLDQRIVDLQQAMRF